MLALECLSGWHIVSYPHIGTDNGSFSHGNASENGCIGIDNYIVVKYGVTGIILHWISIDIQRETFSSQGNPLVELDIFTNNTSRTDNDPRTMVNGEVFADFCSRMNIDTSFAVCQLRDNTGDKWHTQFVELVSNTVTG